MTTNKSFEVGSSDGRVFASRAANLLLAWAQKYEATTIKFPNHYSKHKDDKNSFICASRTRRLVVN
ncbi:hypothetical protein pdam_00014114 [Pocillopora damicornis]|uniref:Uncharacterized protein n=1 Tax=Pocillopora damicornis TaxID=46731 RepID=A0A3M6UN71_POCDA|nr:hypothetical protein pdam_00014114 [Pocillopora damicornis]